MKRFASKFPTAKYKPKSRYLPHVFTEQGIHMLATSVKVKLQKNKVFL